MLAIIEAVAMPQDERGRRVKLYAYTAESPNGRGDRVQDANLALEIVKSVSGPAEDAKEGDDYIIEAHPPRGKEYQRLFEIVVTVENTHKEVSRQTADYHRFDGCPACVSKEMMGIYAMVRKVLRRGLNAYREMKTAKKRVRAA